MLKVGLLSSAKRGGAGIAATRISAALDSQEGIICDFIDQTALGSIQCDALYPGSASNNLITDTHYTAEHASFYRQWVVELLSSYDLLNVHWASFLVTTRELLEIAKRKVPIVFTLHDFFYSTGGCHYQAACDRQSSGCLSCPQVDQNIFSCSDVATAYEQKRTLLSMSNVFTVAPSRYVIERILASGLSDPKRAHVIRNAYQPLPLDVGNDVRYQWDVRRRNLLLIADSLSEGRKGVRLAVDAVDLARADLPTGFSLFVLGDADSELREYCQSLGINVTFLGRMSNQKDIDQVYAKCGFLITCSSEDNWPNILVEGGSAGVIPIVCKGHGCEEFTREFDCGFISSDYKKEAVASTLVSAMGCEESYTRSRTLSERVRASHAYRLVGAKYSSLFRDAISV